jgi:hypothetical protein
MSGGSYRIDCDVVTQSVVADWWSHVRLPDRARFLPKPHKTSIARAQSPSTSVADHQNIENCRHGMTSRPLSKPWFTSAAGLHSGAGTSCAPHTRRRRASTVLRHPLSQPQFSHTVLAMLRLRIITPRAAVFTVVRVNHAGNGALRFCAWH